MLPDVRQPRRSKVYWRLFRTNDEVSMQLDHISGQRQLDAAPCKANALCGSCETFQGMPREQPPHAGLLHTRNQREMQGGAMLDMEHYECTLCPACWLRPPLPGLLWQLIDPTAQARVT
jgi:hypothetical protein